MKKTVSNIRSITICPFAILLMSLLFTGCASKPETQHVKNDSVTQRVAIASANKRNNTLMQHYSKWKGTPYKYGGTGKNGIDCSAFVQTILKESHQFNIPRTTEQQSKVGIRVPYSKAKSGDLVFFKTSSTSRHVGIYLGNDIFMHVSTSQGVILSRLDNPYWSSTFWQFRRLHKI